MRSFEFKINNQLLPRRNSFVHCVIKMGTKNIYFLYAFCMIAIGVCIMTLCQFVLFLSSHSYLNSSNYIGSVKNNQHHGSVFLPLLCNVFLLGIFMFQHTFQADVKVKNLLYAKRLHVIERLLYNLAACLCLKLLMWLWQPIPSLTLWEISTSDRPVLWWIFTTIQSISWLIIYSGCFILDITELSGLKQVYHYINEWPPPLYQKSEDLKRFYSHMRHPSFAGIIVILICHPVMQLDRLLLVYLLAIYMILKFRVDKIDYYYHKKMLQKKCQNLVLN